MAVMEFLKKNFLNTTTQVTVDSSTGTAQYLFNRHLTLGFVSQGYNSTTATVISVAFANPTIASHVLIQNHNLKNFSVYYGGTTTNSLFSTTTNSGTSSYISFPNITISSIQLRMVDTIGGGVEKKVGEFVITNRETQFERNPTIAKFMPITFRKQVNHGMPDGGVTLYSLRDRYRAKLSWDFVTSSFRNTLNLLYRSALPLYFIPKPTTTAWDGNASEINWIGDFDFQYSDNSKEVGFNGSIEIQQTPAG